MKISGPKLELCSKLGHENCRALEPENSAESEHYRVNWGDVGRFLDHNIRHMIARDSPNPTGAFHTSTESVDSLVSKYRPSIINALVVSQSESRKLYDVILGQSRTERGNFVRVRHYPTVVPLYPNSTCGVF